MRLLGKIFLFIGLTVAMYVGTFTLLARYGPGWEPLIYDLADYYTQRGGITWLKYEEFTPAVKHDVVIIGSSHAQQGYDPHIFTAHGYSAFNLGSNSQTPFNSYYVIKHVLDSTNTSLLIFDLYDVMFCQNGLESTSDLTQNISSNAAALDMAWGLHDLRSLNLTMLRFMGRNATDRRSKLHYTGLGSAVNPDSIGSYLPARRSKSRKLELLPIQKQYFKACVQLCQERGIRMVVCSHYGRKDKNVERHDIFVSFIDSALTGSGIRYLDFSFEPGVDDHDHFSDGSHLNSAGAKIFTGHLVDSLEALGYLRKPE